MYILNNKSIDAEIEYSILARIITYIYIVFQFSKKN